MAAISDTHHLSPDCDLHWLRGLLPKQCRPWQGRPWQGRQWQRPRIAKPSSPPPLRTSPTASASPPKANSPKPAKNSKTSNTSSTGSSRLRSDGPSPAIPRSVTQSVVDHPGPPGGSCYPARRVEPPRIHGKGTTSRLKGGYFVRASGANPSHPPYEAELN